MTTDKDKLVKVANAKDVQDIIVYRRKREIERRGASILLLAMKRKGFSLDTEQALWLKDKCSLYA